MAQLFFIVTDSQGFMGCTKFAVNCVLIQNCKILLELGFGYGWAQLDTLSIKLCKSFYGTQIELSRTVIVLTVFCLALVQVKPSPLLLSSKNVVLFTAHKSTQNSPTLRLKRRQILHLPLTSGLTPKHIYRMMPRPSNITNFQKTQQPQSLEVRLIFIL